MISGQPIRVLVVDDNRGDYVLIDRMLRDVRPGEFEVTWASTFEAGESALVQTNPDVCLIDYRLDGARDNGLDLVKIAVARHRSLPIIVLTGMGNPNADMEALWLGATHYLEKDRLDGVRLERAIRYAMEQKEKEEAQRRRVETLERQVLEQQERLKEKGEGKRRIEAQLRQAQKLDALGQVVGGVAHDFNNYLGVMRGYLEMALDACGQGNRLHRYLLHTLQSVNKSARLVGQLLAFSSQNPQEKHPLSLNRQMHALQAFLRRVLTERIEVRLDLDDGLWPVIGDSGALDQVILNLAVNARDAMPEGGVLTLRTRNIAQSESGAQAAEGCVCFSVIDTGTGISPEVQSRMFEPFFTTKSGRGTGLGLSVVYGIVRAHNGQIEVESEPGKGARFDIYLPAARQALLPEETGDPVAGLLTPDGHGERILVVEDDPAFGEMIREVLLRNGYDAILCATALEANAFFQKEIPDMVLADEVLPDGRGTDLIRRFAGDFGGRAALLMSGYPEEWVKPTDLVLLQKPMAIPALLSQVKASLENRN